MAKNRQRGTSKYRLGGSSGLLSLRHLCASPDHTALLPPCAHPAPTSRVHPASTRLRPPACAHPASTRLRQPCAHPARTPRLPRAAIGGAAEQRTEGALAHSPRLRVVRSPFPVHVLRILSYRRPFRALGAASERLRSTVSVPCHTVVPSCAPTAPLPAPSSCHTHIMPPSALCSICYHAPVGFRHPSPPPPRANPPTGWASSEPPFDLAALGTSPSPHTVPPLAPFYPLPLSLDRSFHTPPHSLASLHPRAHRPSPVAHHQLLILPHPPLTPPPAASNNPLTPPPVFRVLPRL